MKAETIAKAERAHEFVESGMSIGRALTRVGMNYNTYYTWRKENGRAATFPQATAGVTITQTAEGETVAGRLLRSNLPDADKLELLRGTYR